MNEYSFSAIEFAKIQGVVINKAEILWIEDYHYTSKGEEKIGTRIVFRNKEAYVFRMISVEDALKELKINVM